MAERTKNQTVPGGPFAGVTAELGILWFAAAMEKHGFRANPR